MALERYTKDGGPSLGMAMRFSVVAENGIDLGSWRSCKGLAVDFETESVVTGGDYSAQTVLPVGLKYNPIKLERVMTNKDSATVRDWLRDKVAKWVNGDGDYHGSSVTITLYDSSNAEVFTWELKNAFPKSWKGPDLDAKASDFAIETLEFVHEGFL